LYLKHGADMDLLFIGSSTTAVQALLGGDVDIVYSAAEHSFLKSNREELKRVLRATIAAYDLAIQEPALAKKAIGKYTRTTDVETLNATYKENVKEYALRIPYVSAAGLRSIVDFRSETAAEVKKLALDRMYDNSLLQEIQKETTK
jgi:ABC-type nitrate/sulfonate/bicarbonate transport system substrate-binding protein